MDSNRTSAKRKQIEAALASVKALAATLEAILIEPETEGSNLIDAKTALRDYGVGVDAIKAAVGRGELQAGRGARGKILVERSELESWIKGRPVQPRKRSTTPVDDLDDWEREADRVMQGGAK